MTHKTIYNNEINTVNYKYEFQPELTSTLDNLSNDFDQSIINQIVLWKVNRYVNIDEKTFNLLNSIDKTQKTIDIELTKQLLELLLKTKGIRLPMASTILRFKNPNIYQIIDQRVYRVINEEDKELKLSLDIYEQIKIYLDYLETLKKVCFKKGIEFSEADRVLYSFDKNINKGIKIKY